MKANREPWARPADATYFHDILFVVNRRIAVFLHAFPSANATTIQKKFLPFVVKKSGCGASPRRADLSVTSGNLWFSDLYFGLYGMLANYFSVSQSGSGDVSLLE